MKFIISFMVMLSIFPIVNILCRAYNLDSITSAILYVVYLKNAIISTGIAFLTGTFLKVKHKKILQIAIVFVLGLGISFIDSFILKDISSMFVIISSIIISLIMLRLYYLSNDIFSNVYIFIGTSCIYIVCTFMGWQTELGSPKWINMVIYLLFCIVFAILINRNNLERVVYRRNQNLDSVPKNIFRYNSKLTLIMCIVPLPLIIFSNRLGSALYGLFISVCRSVVYILKVVSQLFKKDTPTIEDTPSDTLEYTPYYKETSSMLVDISTIIFCIFLIWLVYYYHESIIRKSKELLRYIKSKLIKSLKFEDVTKVEEIPSSESYTDYVQDMVKNIYTKKDFKKDLKRFSKMPTSKESIQFGYSTLIYGLNLLDYNIQSFNTVTDISNMLPYNEFSKVYLDIRYGSYEPTYNDTITLYNLLKDVLKKM